MWQLLFTQGSTLFVPSITDKQSICFAESSHHIYVLPKDPNRTKQAKTPKHVGWLTWKAEKPLRELGHIVTPGSSGFHCMQPSVINRAWSAPTRFTTVRGNVALADSHLRSVPSAGSNSEEHMASRTKGKSHEGTHATCGGCSWRVYFRKVLYRRCDPTERPSAITCRKHNTCGISRCKNQPLMVRRKEMEQVNPLRLHQFSCLL